MGHEIEGSTLVQTGHDETYCIWGCSICGGSCPSILAIQDNADKVDVANPRFDYIPPELVNLYVTNFSVVPSLRSGSHQPSYIYRLLTEYYVPDDYEL